MKAYGVRSYMPEKKQKGQRNWAGKAAEYKRCTRTGGECGASTARAYCGGAASWSSAQLRALLRNGRAAALPSARTRKYSEAATDPRGRVQPEPDFEKDAGSGYAAGAEKPGGAVVFAESCAFCWARGRRFRASDRFCPPLNRRGIHRGLAPPQLTPRNLSAVLPRAANIHPEPKRNAALFLSIHEHMQP